MDIKKAINSAALFIVATSATVTAGIVANTYNEISTNMRKTSLGVSNIETTLKIVKIEEMRSDLDEQELKSEKERMRVNAIAIQVAENREDIRRIQRGGDNGSK